MPDHPVGLLFKAPLRWPEGWPRTPPSRRQRWPAEADLMDSATDVWREIILLPARHLVISSDLQLRRDGHLFARQQWPSDPGIALWFAARGKQQCIACDRWTTLEGNLRALRATIEALRGLERWGSSAVLDRVWHAFEALPPGPKGWWVVLGLSKEANAEQIVEAFRRRAKQAHPDLGGSDAAMRELIAARDEGLRSARNA